MALLFLKGRENLTLNSPQWPKQMPAIHLASEEEYTEVTPSASQIPQYHKSQAAPNALLVQCCEVYTNSNSASLQLPFSSTRSTLKGPVRPTHTLWELKHGTPLLSLPGRLGLRSQGEGPLLS